MKGFGREIERLFVEAIYRKVADMFEEACGKQVNMAARLEINERPGLHCLLGAPQYSVLRDFTG